MRSSEPKLSLAGVGLVLGAMVLLEGREVTAMNSPPCATLTERVEFLEICLYNGMSEAEFLTLLNSPTSPSPLQLIQQRGSHYKLGWTSRTCVLQAWFHEGRLATSTHLGQKGWLPEWRTVPLPLARVARLQISSTTSTIETLLTTIERLMLADGHRPSEAPWQWRGWTLGEQQTARIGYRRTFDHEAIPPQPVLHFLILPEFPQPGTLEVRIAPSLPSPEWKDGSLTFPYQVPLRNVNGRQIADFNFLDRLAARFYPIVDTFEQALRHELGLERIERLQ